MWACAGSAETQHAAAAAAWGRSVRGPGAYAPGYRVCGAASPLRADTLQSVAGLLTTTRRACVPPLCFWHKKCVPRQERTRTGAGEKSSTLGPMQPIADNPAVPLMEVQPRVVRFPEMDAVNCAEFSADGKSLYVEIPVEVINLGAVVMNWGGWLALVVIVPLVMASVVWWWRVAVRPRVPRGRYCRKCNYDVGPTVDGGGPQCTECGTEFARKPPVVGRRRWLRRAPAMVLGLLAVASAFAAYSPWTKKPVVLGIAQRAGVSRWAWEQMTRRQIPLKATWLSEGSMLLEVDASTGERVRTIDVRAERSFAGMKLMPDGKRLLMVSAAGVVCVRLSDGRRLDEFTVPGMQWDWEGSIFQGFCDDGQSALLSCWSFGETEVRLSAWNPTTGAVRIIATSTSKYEGRSREDYGRELVVSGRDQQGQVTRVLTCPTSLEASSRKTYEVEFIDVRTGTRTTTDLGPDVNVRWKPTVTADGAVVFTTRNHGSAIIAIDPSNAQVLGWWASKSFINSCILMRNDRWMVMRSWESVTVRDIHHKKWLAKLSFPSGDHQPTVVASPDGNRIAAVLVTRRKIAPVAGMLRYSSELAIWDVDALANAE